MAAARREVEPQAVELADGEVRAADRRQDGVDPRAVGHPGVDDRVRHRQLAPGQGGDSFGDLDELGVRGEAHAGGFEPARSLGEDRVGRVDQDVADLGVLDERLQGAKSADRRLDRGDQGRHRRQLELGVLEDGGDRGPHQLLALGGAVERVEHFWRQARDEHAAHLAEGRRRQR